MIEGGFDEEEEEDEGEVVMDKEEREVEVVMEEGEVVVEEGKWEKVWVTVAEVEVGRKALVKVEVENVSGELVEGPCRDFQMWAREKVGWVVREKGNT